MKHVKLVIKTKYASIERMFTSKMEAVQYLFEVKHEFEVLSYELKEV